jgi:hypothetical protein
VFVGLGVLVCSSIALAVPPARTAISFSAAPLGPASEFSWLHRSGLRAPPSVQRVVVTGRARRIANLTFDGHDYVFFVAPTKTGGYCTAVTGPYGGSGCPNNRPKLDPGLTGDQSGPIVFHGSFASVNAARLKVTYQDGSKGAIPFYWVSAPINAGFFLFPVPAVHRHPGDRPNLLSVYDDTGRALAQTTLRTTGP